MVMRKQMAISLICVSSLSNVAFANPLCSLKSTPSKQIVRINDIPGFFFKVHPDGKVLSFIGPKKNQLMDMETGIQRDSLGQVDPVWSPDGKFFTHPGYGDGSMYFYPEETVLKYDGAISPAFFKEMIDGVYQSIGKTADGYRMVTDKDGASIVDLSFSAEGPKLVTKYKKVCPNIPGMATDLPMLSKDGKYLSVYDSSTTSTKIYNVNSENCSLALDLGFATGKVSFNNDSTQIAFHIDQFAEFQDGYFSGITKDRVKNVIAVKLASSESGEELTPTSWSLLSNYTNPGDGGYYPDYDKEGNIYHLEDVNNMFQFAKTYQEDLEWFDFGTIGSNQVNCVGCTKKEKSPLEVLASLWSSVCKEKAKVDLGKAFLLSVSIEPQNCLSMVEEFWTPSLGSTKAELLAACPKIINGQKTVLGTWDLNKKVTVENLITSKCIICHRNPMEIKDGKYPYFLSEGPGVFRQEYYKAPKSLKAFDLDNLDKETMMYMNASIDSGDMPKGNSLDSQEKELIKNYFQRKTLDFPEKEEQPVVVFKYPEAELEKMRQTYSEQYKDQPEAIPNLILMIDCQYGQKNCQGYLDIMKPTFLAEAASLPGGEREAFIKNKEMSLRCQALFEVTIEQCGVWRKENPKND